MPGRHKPEETINLAAEEYELSTQQADEEPLLPQYDETDRGWTKSAKDMSTHDKQHKWCFRISMLTLAALFAVSLVAGSLTSVGKNAKNAVLDTLIGKPANKGAFPTEYVFGCPPSNMQCRIRRTHAHGC